MGKIQHKLKINPKTGEITGKIIERDRPYQGNLAGLTWRFKGVFVDNYFAGKAEVRLTSWNGQGGLYEKGATYVFESP